jgi:hypothetical protein
MRESMERAIASHRGVVTVQNLKCLRNTLDPVGSLLFPYYFVKQILPINLIACLVKNTNHTLQSIYAGNLKTSTLLTGRGFFDSILALIIYAPTYVCGIFS